MHIMEGFLPVKHAIGWSVASAPFVAYGLHSVNKRIKEKPEQRMLLGVAAAFTFVLSALKMPSVTGSCSHPTGTGLGAILFGPAAMAPIGAVVLLFQAILLAHGGLDHPGSQHLLHGDCRAVCRSCHLPAMPAPSDSLSACQSSSPHPWETC